MSGVCNRIIEGTGREVWVLGLTKGGEQQYVWIFGDDKAGKNAALQSIGRTAGDPSNDFTWYDAALLSRIVRETMDIEGN